MPESELLQYFMGETNKRFDSIDEKLDDIHQFKVSLIAQSRLTALIVSGLCGFITLLATVALAWFTAKPPHG